MATLGEMLPPPPSSLLKFTNSNTFLNSKCLRERVIASPWDESQHKVPQQLQSETKELIGRIMPDFAKRDVAYWRICWDAVTPQQHQLIARHPDERLHNLYFAIGGSFHSWKFLPTIGWYVSNVLEGTSNGEGLDQTWEWKSGGWASEGRGAHEKVLPKRTLRDLSGEYLG